MIRRPTDPRPPERRFTVTEDGCWTWDGYLGSNGYGRLNVDGRRWLAHRYVYEQLVGPIPEGFDLDHLCRVRSCVNPRHLDPVNRLTNLMRAPGTQAYINATKTHCKRGHEFTPDNIYWQNGSRSCRACVTLRHARRRARLHAEMIERVRLLVAS